MSNKKFRSLSLNFTGSTRMKCAFVLFASLTVSLTCFALEVEPIPFKFGGVAGNKGIVQEFPNFLWVSGVTLNPPEIGQLWDKSNPQLVAAKPNSLPVGVVSGCLAGKNAGNPGANNNTENSNQNTDDISAGVRADNADEITHIILPCIGGLLGTLAGSVMITLFFKFKLRKPLITNNPERNIDNEADKTRSAEERRRDWEKYQIMIIAAETEIAILKLEKLDVPQEVRLKVAKLYADGFSDMKGKPLRKSEDFIEFIAMCCNSEKKKQVI